MGLVACTGPIHAGEAAAFGSDEQMIVTRFGRGDLFCQDRPSSASSKPSSLPAPGFRGSRHRQ